MAQHTVAKIGDLPDGEGVVVKVGERELALFHCDGTVRAMDNLCPHRGGPLGEGFVEDGVVSCPWHGWEFGLDDGAARHRPEIKAACFAVRVDGDDVIVDLGEGDDAPPA